MKFANIALALPMVFGLAGAANAQTSPYASPEDCVAEVGALDVDGDGYVSDAEYTEYGNIETNVDTDGDGRISGEELTVACESETMQALQPSD